jgi:hypothetical protein
MTTISTAKRFLLISDFDQTLSFHDSGLVLSELLGLPNFLERTAGLADIHLVQQGAELSYLLLHDPDFRRVRREHLIEVGKRVRLKQNIGALSRMLKSIDGCDFDYYVVSAAPEEVIQSALEGIVDESHIFGTRFRYNQHSGEIESIVRVPAGYEGRRSGPAARIPRDQSRPHYLRGRRQLRRARDAAFEPAERSHDRGLGKSLHHRDRKAYRFGR